MILVPEWKDVTLVHQDCRKNEGIWHKLKIFIDEEMICYVNVVEITLNKALKNKEHCQIVEAKHIS